MKKILKIIVGIIMIVSLAIGFLPFIRLGGLDFSVFDLAVTATGKTVAGDYDHLGTQLVSQMTELSEEYLGPYLLEVGVFAAAILIAAILTMILSWKIAYYISMVGTLVIGGCSVFIFNQIKPELDAIGSSLDFFGLDEAMEIERLTLVLWCLVWALVLVLSVYGVIISRRENRIQAEEMPEHIFTPPMPMPGIFTNVSVPKEEGENSVQNTTVQDFQGAIVSRNPFYGNRAYPLMERTEVFFAEENGNVYLTDRNGTDIFAGVYFIREYQEYCIDVLQSKSVYLSSGQPLGVGRRYYLPRGMEIYLKNQNFLFELA